MEKLSESETRIARLLIKSDLMCKEIADELNLGHETVRTHTKSIYRKTGAFNRRHLKRDAALVAHCLGPNEKSEPEPFTEPYLRMDAGTDRWYGVEPRGQRRGVPFGTPSPRLFGVHAPGMEHLWLTYDEPAAVHYARHNAAVVIAFPIVADFRSVEADDPVTLMARQLANEGVPLLHAEVIAANFYQDVPRLAAALGDGRTPPEIDEAATPAPGCTATRKVNGAERCTEPICRRCWPGFMDPA